MLFENIKRPLKVCFLDGGIAKQILVPLNDQIHVHGREVLPMARDMVKLSRLDAACGVSVDEPIAMLILNAEG